MLTRLQTKLVPPADDDTFEELVRDLCASEWSDPKTERFGRSGQKQHGVDIYGQPVNADGNYRGAQAKLRSTGRQLSEAEIRAEVVSARTFPHALDELILMTTAPRDTATQILVDTISAEEQANGGFGVSMRSWDRLAEQLSAHPALLVKYYRDHYAGLTTNAQFDRLIHLPISVAHLSVGAMDAELLSRLVLRGIRLTDVKGHLDGIVLQLADNAPVERAAAELMSHWDKDPPCFVVLSESQQDAFITACEKFGIDVGKLELLPRKSDPDALADLVLTRCFAYGYEQRGALSTLEVCARTRPNTPNSTLLDLNWQALFSDGWPSEALWRAQLKPALNAVTREVTGVRDFAFVTLESHLYLPLAVALGYHLNLRVAKLGVWTRREANMVSTFSQQFWRSDGQGADVALAPNWHHRTTGALKKTVLELSTMGSIHHDVSAFVEAEVVPEGWLDLQLELGGTVDIDEAHAVAFAERVGQLARELRTMGMQDLHIFLKMPSALGVLIGQRLQACGRIHLYWFDNPSYRYAFTLT